VAEVRLENLGKVFPNGTVAVHALDLTLADGELLVLVGPSGCGKTTILRMVAGLEHSTSGTISIGDRVVNRLSEAERDIAMVFQNYALYPHMTVYSNIAFPLRLARIKKAERDERVRRVAAILGLTEHLQQKPAQLSGGQRQRVAMGRAIVRQPQLFLMDEPLSNLDAKLRVQMRGDILDLQRRLGVTTIYVTHDQAEAMTLGDRVVVMRTGELQQVGTPESVYSQPANLFVASFLGSPPMNLVRARLEADEAGGIAAAIGAQRVALDAAELDRHPGLAGRAGADIVLGVRPESLHPASGAGARRIEGDVVVRESLGSDVFARVRLPDAEPLKGALHRLALDAEEAEQLEETRHEAVFVARLPAETAVERHERIALSVGAGALRFFDADTGRALARSAPPPARRERDAGPSEGKSISAEEATR
jgi:multiple sugar transport system ATP-binding protein